MDLIRKLSRFVAEETCPVSEQCVPGFVSGAHTGWGWARERVGRIVAENPIPVRGVPDAAVCFFKDGDKWCCVHGDFVNLQESDAGFGDTFEEAMNDLAKFKPHYHAAGAGADLDTCSRCGRDIRNPIHFRSTEAN